MLKTEVAQYIQIHRAIWAFMEGNRERSLRESEIIREIQESTGFDTETIQENLRRMIDKGTLTYSHCSRFTSVEIPEEKYHVENVFENGQTPEGKYYTVALI